MYQLLIVDDEIHAVRGISACLNWQSLGFVKVHTAYNIRQAMEVFANQPIDIMICDIEMPNGNGLDLLDWVRQNYTRTISILLTCHSEFSYAKQAIQLGAMEYLLKPVRANELEDVIRKAQVKIDQERELLNKNELYRHYYGLWSNYHSELLERFWFELLNGRISSEPAKIQKKLFEFDIHDCDNFWFTLIMIKPCALAGVELAQQISSQNQHYVQLKSKISEWFETSETPCWVVSMENGSLISIHLSNYKSDALDHHLTTNYLDLLKDCRQNLDLDFCGLLGSTVRIHELTDLYRSLLATDEKNVYFEAGIIRPNDMLVNNKKVMHLEMPMLIAWRDLLFKRDENELIQSIDQYISKVTNDCAWTSDVLVEFYRNFIQIIHYVLVQKELSVNQVFTMQEINAWERASTRSVSEFRKWIDYIIKRVLEMTRAADQTQSLIDRVKRFIELNIENEISRVEIADHFHISPDYMTKIFKKETGFTISEYMIQERVKLATELLINTDLPVSKIANQVGYTNFSHFSKLFKSETGMNPLDFRKSRA